MILEFLLYENHPVILWKTNFGFIFVAFSDIFRPPNLKFPKFWNLSKYE